MNHAGTREGNHAGEPGREGGGSSRGGGKVEGGGGEEGRGEGGGTEGDSHESGSAIPWEEFHFVTAQ